MESWLICEILLEDSGWLSSDADMADNLSTHCILGYFSSCRCKTEAPKAPTLSAAASPAFCTLPFDFETFQERKKLKLLNFELPLKRLWKLTQTWKIEKNSFNITAIQIKIISMKLSLASQILLYINSANLELIFLSFLVFSPSNPPFTDGNPLFH